MNNQKLAKTAAKLAEPLPLTNGDDFRLKDFDPSDTGNCTDKESAADSRRPA